VAQREDSAPRKDAVEWVPGALAAVVSRFGVFRFAWREMVGKHSQGWSMWARGEPFFAGAQVSSRSCSF
jgi:hypothetical protein